MMRHRSVLHGGRGWKGGIVALPLLLAAGCSVWAGTDLGGCEELAVEDVARLVEEGVGEDVVVAKIRQCPGDYDLSAAKILELHEKGVGAKILDAMLETEKEKAGPGPAYCYPACDYRYPYPYPPWWFRGHPHYWGPFWGPGW